MWNKFFLVTYFYNFKAFHNIRMEVCCKKDILKNFIKFAGIHLSQGLFFLIKLEAEVCNSIIKEPLAQVFWCKFCEICKNIKHKI